MCVVGIVGVSPEVCAAVRHLLNAIGYEGKVADRTLELPHVLMEVDPEDVQWLKVSSRIVRNRDTVKRALVTTCIQRPLGHVP